MYLRRGRSRAPRGPGKAWQAAAEAGPACTCSRASLRAALPRRPKHAAGRTTPVRSPSRQRERVGEGQPVAVHFKVGGPVGGQEEDFDGGADHQDVPGADPHCGTPGRGSEALMEGVDGADRFLLLAFGRPARPSRGGLFREQRRLWEACNELSQSCCLKSSCRPCGR